MSRATKRKHVVKEVTLDILTLPSPSQEIVRVLGSRGNNLHAVETSEKIQFLVSMPTKFRKNVWIKRGDFVLVEPISEGDKVKAEIVTILTADHIEYYKENHCWPAEFEEDRKETTDDDIFVNRNRTAMNNNYDSSDSDSSSDNDSSSEGDDVPGDNGGDSSHSEDENNVHSSANR